MTLPVFLQATQMARAWVGCVAMVCEFLKTEPGLLSSALTPTPQLGTAGGSAQKRSGATVAASQVTSHATSLSKTFIVHLPVSDPPWEDFLLTAPVPCRLEEAGLQWLLPASLPPKQALPAGEGERPDSGTLAVPLGHRNGSLQKQPEGGFLKG